MDGEAGRGQLGQQLVRRGPGEPEIAGNRSGRYRGGSAGQQSEHRQATTKRRGRAGLIRVCDDGMHLSGIPDSNRCCALARVDIEGIQ